MSDGLGRSLRPDPILACSLTRAAAAELVGRDLPIRDRMIGTLHAHAYRSVGQGSVVGLAVIQAWNDEHPRAWRLSQDCATSAGGTDDIDHTIPDTAQEGDQSLARVDLLRHRMLPLDDWPSRDAEFGEQWLQHLREHEALDFTCMIERALELGSDPPGSPAVIMVDEAQDLSRLEYQLVQMWSEKCDAVIYVGDSYQALYEWRGADPKILSPGAATGDQYRVLGRSHRVPRAVVRVATAWLKSHFHDFQPVEYSPRPPVQGDDPPGGHVEAIYRCMGRAGDTDRIVDDIIDHERAGRSVMIQASCGYIVDPVISALRDAGVPFANPWKSHRADWNPLARGTKNVTAADRLRALFVGHDAMGDDQREPTLRDIGRAFGVSRSKGLLARGEKRTLAKWAKLDSRSNRLARPEDLELVFADTDTAKSAMHAMLGVIPEADAARWWLDTLPPKQRKAQGVRYLLRVVDKRGVRGLIDPPKIYVGTCHSFKGGEADVVYVAPDLSRAGYLSWCDAERQDSVVRVFYVALTRARHRVYVTRASSPRCVPLWSHVRGMTEEAIKPWDDSVNPESIPI